MSNVSPSIKASTLKFEPIILENNNAKQSISRIQNKQPEPLLIDIVSDSQEQEIKQSITNITEENASTSKNLNKSTVPSFYDEGYSNVVAVFVVRFDTRKGNIIEWQYPQDVDLNGIEFQAIPSGLHAVSQDIMPPLYGLSVFKNEPTSDQSHDRGARMAAVGILVTPTHETGLCGRPWSQLEFLQNEIGRHVHQTDDYSNLIQFFEKRGMQLNYSNDDPLSIDSENSLQHSRRRALTTSSGRTSFIRNRCFSASQMSTTSYQASLSPLHPANHFQDFVRALGPNIFLLWKAALLKKRILFYSTPPIGNACYSVYGTCLLANIPSAITWTFKNKVEKIKPLFCVGVSDIPMIEVIESGYVACTTDQILQDKSNLYDLLINFPSCSNSKSHPNLIASPESFLSTKINSADIRRYRVLLKMLASYGENNLEVEEDGGAMTDTWCKIMFGGWFWWYGREGYKRINENYFIDEGGILLNSQEDLSNTATTNSSPNLDVLKDTPNIEVELIRFFQALTTNIFNTLRTLITSFDQNGNEETIYLYPNHIIQLGLDPHDDGVFVEGLAKMYFGKKVEVIGKDGNCLSHSCNNICSALEE
nr:13420_t:CDS:10 [Entrophospora candida]